MAGKVSTPVDVHVGSLVRLRRMFLSISQEKLGKELGISFQQLQKYETGVNRIGAGRLFQIATLLGVDVGYFFEDAPDPGVTPRAGTRGATAEASILDFLNTREGLELNRAFHAITDPARRRTILELVRAVNGGQARRESGRGDGDEPKRTSRGGRS